MPPLNDHPPHLPYHAELNRGLMDAVHSGDLARVEWAVRQGADIHVQDNKVMIEAAAKGYLDILTYLIENAKKSGDWRLRIVHAAITHNQLDALKLIHKHGIHLACRNNDSAIAVAAVSGHFQIIKFLLDLNFEKPKDLNDALQRLVRANNQPLVEFMIGTGSFAQDALESALATASWWGFNGIVEMLLKHQVQIHADDDAALRNAADRCRISTVQLLLEHGANLHVFRDSVIMLAATLASDDLKKPALFIFLIDWLFRHDKGNCESKENIEAAAGQLINRIEKEYPAGVSVPATKLLRERAFYAYCDLTRARVPKPTIQSRPTQSNIL